MSNHQNVGALTNFQAASCTLDASVKIYSCRVDSVHSETFKVLGGLSRAERDDVEEDQVDSDGNETSGEQDKDGVAKKEKKKKKNTGQSTLESNIENLNCKVVDQQIFADPLFGKTSASFDEGGARGLLLNKLSVDGSCKLIFDSNDAVVETEQMAAATQEQSVGKQVNSELNAMDQDDSFDHGGDDDDQQGGIDLEVDEDIFIPQMDDNNNNAAFEEDDNNIGGNNGGDDFYQTYANNEDLDTVDDQQQQQQQQYQQDQTTEFEFDFFVPNLNQNWSGPENWKYGNNRASATNKKTEEVVEKEKKKKESKKAVHIDFSAPVPPDSMFEPPKGRQTSVLTAAAIKKAAETSTLLPPDIHYDIKMLCRLFNKPNSRLIGINGGVLVDEPARVNKVHINYVTVSKSVDLKSVKSNDPDVSVAIAFLCVLHLANEKNLSLQQADKSDLTNFNILLPTNHTTTTTPTTTTTTTTSTTRKATTRK
eukprot:gene19976-23938_t